MAEKHGKKNPTEATFERKEQGVLTWRNRVFLPVLPVQRRFYPELPARTGRRWARKWSSAGKDIGECFGEVHIIALPGCNRYVGVA